MRRLLSGGVLLSLGLVAVHAAVEAWLEARAVVALEQAARRLPDGGRLVWQRLDAEPVRLALAVEGVRLELPPGGPLRSLDIGAVRLAQAIGGSDTIGALGRFRARDLVIELAEGQGTIRAAEVEGEEVEVRALSEALAAPEPLAALEALHLGPIRARSVVAERDGRRIDLPEIAIGGYAARRLEGLELSGLSFADADRPVGRLEALSIGLLDLAALEGPALAAAAADPAAIPALLDRLRIERVRLAGLELAPPDVSLKLAELGLGRAGQGRIESLAVGGLALGHDQGNGRIDSLALALLDWSRLRPERLAAAAARFGEEMPEDAEPKEAPDAGQPPAGGGVGDRAAPDDAAEEEASRIARSFAGLELLGELLRLEVGPLRLEGFEAGDASAGMALARLAWEGLAAGRIGALELAGFEARGESGYGVRLAELEQSGVAAAPVDLAERLEATPRTAEALQELTSELTGRLPWQGRTALSGLDLLRDGAVGFGLGRLALEFGEEGARKRTGFVLSGLVVDPAVLGSEEAAAGLAAAGIARLELAARLAAVFDPASLELTVEEASIDVVDQATVSIRLTARLGADPALDPMTASIDAEMVRAQVTVRDLGLIDRRLAELARQAGRSRLEFARSLIADARAREPGRSLLDARRATAVERFLAEPGTLVIRLEPRRPMGFMALGLGAMATPRQTLQSAGLEIEALGR